MSTPANPIEEMMNRDRMAVSQMVTILICFLMNVMDGMDVLVISFTAPKISDEWGIPPQELGWVFSAALIGMTVGALGLAPQASAMHVRPFGRKDASFGAWKLS